MEIYGIAIGVISREKVRSMAVYMRYLGVVLGILGAVIEFFVRYSSLPLLLSILGLSEIALVFFVVVGYMGLTAGFLSNWIKMAFILFLLSGVAVGSYFILPVFLLVTHVFFPALSVSIFGYGLKKAMDLDTLGLALMLAGALTFILRYWGLPIAGALLFLTGSKILRTIPEEENEGDRKLDQ